jgi:hypothetical protein
MDRNNQVIKSIYQLMKGVCQLLFSFCQLIIPIRQQIKKGCLLTASNHHLLERDYHSIKENDQLIVIIHVLMKPKRQLFASIHHRMAVFHHLLIRDNLP